MDSVALFAFGFATPWMLWGLALGGIPIIIHLLHKRKYRETTWAAMRFLLEAARKNSRRIRLEQLLLLIVRMLILVMLALALASPYAETFGTYFEGEVPVHRMIVIDASFSMGFQPAEFSRFERAKEIGRKIVAGAKQGDALNLVRICDSMPRTIVRQPAYEKSQVEAEIEQLALTDESGDLFATLRSVAELLPEAPELKQKEIYFISDFQRASWSPNSSGRKAQIRRLLKQLSDKASLMLIDVGRSRTPNAAITRFQVEEPFVAIGRPVHLQVTVRNFGDAPLGSQSVELFINDRLAESKQIDFPAGAEQQVGFSRTFELSGEYKLEVRLERDSLDVDNRRWLSLPVRDHLNVLLVNGKQSGRLMGKATDHLQLALSPSLIDKQWRGLIRPRRVNEGELPEVDLSRYDCVFLCNVRLFTQPEADLLRSYVESGGALVFSLGDQVQADNYNQVLYRDGKGILPAKLGDLQGNTGANQEFFEFDPRDFGHPIVNAFQGNPDAGLETTPTFHYVKATLPTDKNARVALWFDSGDPAIVEAAIGRGRSILLTTSLDKQWGTWVVWPGFPPLMTELVHFAVSGRWSERQLLVGDPLLRSFPTRVFDMPATLKLPDGEEQPLRLTETDSSTKLAYDATAQSGVYEVVLGPPLNRSEYFAVNVDAGESDLAKVEENELHSELLAGVDFVYRTSWQDFHREATAAVAERGGVSRWLLGAAFCLVFVEQLMAWSFFRGFLLLYAVVAFGFVQQVFERSALPGLLLLAAFTIGFAVLVRASQRSRAGTG